MTFFAKVRQKWENFCDIKRQAEINRLITRAGRRVTRDFRHAVNDIYDDKLRAHYSARVRMWQDVFWDCSQYRDQLHHAMDRLEQQVSLLEKQVHDLGHEPVTKAVPF